MNDLAYAQLVLSQTVKDLDDLIGKFPSFKEEGEQRKASCKFGAKILELYATFESPIPETTANHPRHLPATDANGGWEPPLG